MKRHRFYRVRSKAACNIEGTGLGLAIVKSTVEQHGGKIEVASEVGKGTCFAITLTPIGLVKNLKASQVS